ncbi:MAG: S-layer homology domain-containing protein [Clostridia bacterium]|nr:S-layer homology domain-containing protein [Clostridiales bacterium]MDU7505345.1 S-layer homology domain-containing protein [Clostridia bacterium]
MKKTLALLVALTFFIAALPIAVLAQSLPDETIPATYAQSTLPLARSGQMMSPTPPEYPSTKVIPYKTEYKIPAYGAYKSYQIADSFTKNLEFMPESFEVTFNDKLVGDEFYTLESDSHGFRASLNVNRLNAMLNAMDGPITIRCIYSAKLTVLSPDPIQYGHSPSKSSEPLPPPKPQENVKVNLVWEDFNNKFNTRPSSPVEVTIVDLNGTDHKLVFPAEQVKLHSKTSLDSKLQLDEIDHIKLLQEISGYKFPDFTWGQDSVTITYKMEPIKEDVQAKVIWLGDGPEPDTDIELWRKTEDSKSEQVASFTANESTTRKTFSNQDKHDEKGEIYTYYLEQRTTPKDYIANINGLTVTNTYQPEKTEDLIAKKIWQDNRQKHPDISFELWRKGGTGGNGEIVVKATPVENDQINFGKQLKRDKNGTAYEYFVREVEVPDGYTKAEEGLTVTNTYHPEQTEDLIARKIWQDNRQKHPDISFELWRKGGTAGAGEIVVDATPVKNDQVNFGKQLKKDDNGVTYEYFVREVQVPDGYTKAEDGLTVTNTLTVKHHGGGAITSSPKLNKEDHFPYVVGYPDGTFKPKGNMTRAEMTAIFSRLLKEKLILNEDYPLPFTDVHRSDWYASCIGYLTQMDLVHGYPDGTFKPDNPVTRAEFAAVASKFIENKKAAGGFKDIKNEYWAKASIESVQAAGWIAGYPDGTFNPEQNITRAEAVAIVNKMLDRNGNGRFVDNYLNDMVSYVDLSDDDWAFYPIMEAANGHDYLRLANRQEKWIKIWS